MRYEFPPDDRPLDPCWFAPLEDVARLLAHSPNPTHAYFAVGDFMFMTRIARPPRPSIYLYKHRHTRRYLNLDEAGHAYRYFPPRNLESRSPGQYRLHRNLIEAVDRIGLWQLIPRKPRICETDGEFDDWWDEP